jgi:hypothetical protein
VYHEKALSKILQVRLQVVKAWKITKENQEDWQKNQNLA